jgi:hypothetical protein
MKGCGVPDAPTRADATPLTMDRLHDLCVILRPNSRYVPGPQDAADLLVIVQAEIARREAQGEI